MIIIKIIILYFIQIRHTDDFPSAGTRLVSVKMHNLFLINVGPVIIVAVACRLTGCKPRGNSMF